MDQPVTWLEFLIVIGVLLAAELLWSLWQAAVRLRELRYDEEDDD